MSDVVISIENLSKSYQLGVIGTGTFRGDLQRWWARMRGLSNPLAKVGEKRPDKYSNETFWALKDVSFKVHQGESVGIIGRNGAGKSTLLKILSRITAPTSGFGGAKGRIASLLEVGTGFHPELTGVENIYLNGAIMGMSRTEVDRKLDEIIDFSGVEKFINTPVKRYSSGMYVRLAFAVSAHLEPDILVVDEVLSVGDAEFQKKCLGKIGDVTASGRTVLFVSHSMQSIRNLCSRCIVLEHGTVALDAPTEEALSFYSASLRGTKIDAETGIGEEKYRRGAGKIRFTSVTLKDVNGNSRYNFAMGETIRFELSYKIFEQIEGLAVALFIRSGNGDMVTSVRHLLSSVSFPASSRGMVVIELPDIYIRPGEYPLYIHISGAVPNEFNFDVLDDLTPPLVVTVGDKEHPDFDATRPVGYFSVPSRVIFNEVHG